MNLIDSIVEIFRESLTTVFKREANEEKYMRQTILGTRWRAFWGIFVAVVNAFKPMVRALAYAIAKHRQEAHNEDKTRTLKSISRSMSNEELEKAAETQAYWSVG